MGVKIYSAQQLEITPDHEGLQGKQRHVRSVGCEAEQKKMSSYFDAWTVRTEVKYS